MQSYIFNPHRTVAPIRHQSNSHRSVKIHTSKDDEQNTSSPNKLATIIRRKQQQIQQKIDELGDDLGQRLESATATPLAQPYRLSQSIVEIVPTGRPVLVFEIGRSPDVTSPQHMAEIAARLASAGADALVVPTDSDETPEGLADIFAVSRAAPSIPTLSRDWFLHPIQVVDAKEAGCAGIIGVIASVTGPRGTPVLSSFAAALGLDCPVEVVNLAEMKAMEQMRVPFFGLNLSVGLSVSIAGFGSDVASGVLGELPFGVISLVGVKSLGEARSMRLAGADALLIKKELVAECIGKEAELVDRLLDIVNLE